MTHRLMDGEHVSVLWFPLLHDIRYIDKVDFDVNEARRTRKRQAELVREKGLWSPSNPTGAAAVSDEAPHIRVGRPDHAIDFNNATGVVRAAAKRGVRLDREIAAEPWHTEIHSVAQVQAYNARRRKRMAALRHKLARVKLAIKRLSL